MKTTKQKPIRASLAALVADLGLELISTVRTSDGDQLRKYDWPATGRVLVVKIQPSGEWQDYLATKTLAADRTAAELRAMAAGMRLRDEALALVLGLLPGGADKGEMAALVNNVRLALTAAGINLQSAEAADFNRIQRENDSRADYPSHDRDDGAPSFVLAKTRTLAPSAKDKAHTPGPWHLRPVVVDGKLTALLLETKHRPVPLNDPCILAIREDWVVYLDTTEHGKANVRLIEAAPDLYDASSSTVSRLANLGQYLRKNGAGVLASILDEELAKHVAALKRVTPLFDLPEKLT